MTHCREPSIAGRLVLSLETVPWHLTNRKLEQASRAASHLSENARLVVAAP